MYLGPRPGPFVPWKREVLFIKVVAVPASLMPSVKVAVTKLDYNFLKDMNFISGPEM